MIVPWCVLEVRGWGAAEVLPLVHAALAGTELYLGPLQALVAAYADASEWVPARPSWAIEALVEPKGETQLAEIARYRQASPLWDTGDDEYPEDNWWGDHRDQAMLDLLGYGGGCGYAAVVPARGLPGDASACVRLFYTSPQCQRDGPDGGTCQGKCGSWCGHQQPSWLSIAEADPTTNPHWAATLAAGQAAMQLEGVWLDCFGPYFYSRYCAWIASIRAAQRARGVADQHLRIVLWFD